MSQTAYLYGQILGTHSFWLKDGFLKPDEYSEISEKYFLPGGETGTAATVLASLEVQVKIDGTHIGTEVAGMLKQFYADKTVDLSSLTYVTDYEGLMDYVVVADMVRSPMGFFQQLYASGTKRWNEPREIVNLRGDETTVYKLADGTYMDRIERHFTYDGTDTWTDEDGVEWNEVVKTSTNDNSSSNVDEASEDEAWKEDLEESLFENYGVIPKYYEDLGDGIYQVYVEVGGEVVPLVTVDSATGDYQVNREPDA